MSRKAVVLSLCVLLCVASGCATTNRNDYSKFRAEDPKSILIVPVVNRTVNVDAPDYFLATITVPIAERGYYVYPVNAVKGLMQDGGLSDADMVHSADCQKVASLFGADSVLYVTIQRWDAQYILLKTQVTVDLLYELKSGKTGESLWAGRSIYTYSSSGGSSGNLIADLVASAVSAALAKAAPNYVPLARQANAQLIPVKHIGLPAGPHHTEYNKDQKKF